MAYDDRQRIEKLLELGKGELGLDHHKVRSSVGWHHQLTLSCLALRFIMPERQRVEKNTGDHCAAAARDLPCVTPIPRAERDGACAHDQASAPAQ